MESGKVIEAALLDVLESSDVSFAELQEGLSRDNKRIVKKIRDGESK